MRKFRKVAVGGTFDEFHKGHRTLLLKAFEVGEQVVVGLCSDEFVKRMGKPHSTASYKQRLEDLKRFLSEHGFLERAEIIPLNDPYGVTLSKGCVEALVVSRETEPRALEINLKREKLGLPPLHIVVIEMVPSENHAPISTTRIRRGEIDREGHLLKR
ncbi:phosphopantetheine adenylyltransferase [Candidatus Bathyarchaeota archaeon]|nr:MAG: phosphopantetheine adenylyltransferase [Candidatus Bathyarchaeota archaeon]RLI15944.1 MAG: phosphopantetheine adenylyltransferase [Candidatus Bathyarchaeota archaeon]HDN05401.1 phosphopantetheine adenylyltransferase [Candidatus Bathyarchaeota archaeon]